jgi:predicted amidohydrolase
MEARPVDKLRVASLQYFIRPVDSFDQFRDQVAGLVETAADYDVRLLVFPEYFTIQLMTVGNDDKAPGDVMVRRLCAHVDRFREMMAGLARTHGLYIVAGTIPVMDAGSENIFNDCFVFSPRGDVGVQGKLHMTRWEREDWNVSTRSTLRIFDTDLGKMAVAICYDVEFPEIARAAARAGANLLIVPSCTDDRQGFLRVRYCAQARCIENQMYVVHSSTVGSLPMVPSVALNYGQASILTPSDFPFARDGILAEGVVNQETMIIGDLNMTTIEQSRTFGTVLPLEDSARSARIVATPESVKL